MSKTKAPMTNLNGHTFVDQEARDAAAQNAVRIGELSEEMENVGNPTDEQVGAAVNAYLEKNPVETTPADEIVAEVADKVVPRFEVSGSKVEFRATEGQPLDVKCELSMYQEGKGDPTPDNVRPFRVYNGAELTHRSTNLFGGLVFANKLSDSTGTNINTEAHTVTFDPAKCPTGVIYNNFEEGKRYTIILRANAVQVAKPHLNLSVVYADGTFDELYASVANEMVDVVFTTPSGKNVDHIETVWYGGQAVFDYERCGIFEGICDIGDFSAYAEPMRYSVEFAEPLVSGTVDFSGGHVVTDRIYQRVDQLTGWTIYDEGATRYFIAKLPKQPNSQHIVCSHLLMFDGVNAATDSVSVSYGLDKINFVFSPSRNITTVEQFTAWLAAETDKGTPVTVVMPCNATTIPCEAAEIVGNAGANVVECSAGEVTVGGYVNLPFMIKEMSFNADDWGLPVLALRGDISPISISKDTKVTLHYSYEGRSGTCTLKGQGSSSYATAQAMGKRGKYNFTINFDNAFEAKEGWGVQKKYCLKANFIDASHARNIISATLWGKMVKNRAIDDARKTLPNGGAIDGFPIIITVNGEFQGLYTFNIPKDGWMMGMGSGTHEAILCADYSDASWFTGEATLDGDFDVEYATDEDDTEWIKTSVNRLINACRNSDGSDLDTTIAQYLDWDSAIDYFILKKVLNGVDMGGKNYILATYDGVKWFYSAYDMDCVYGLDWDGKKFYTANTGIEFTENEMHTVDRLIMKYKKDLLKQRYSIHRAGVLSDDQVATTFTNFIGAIPSAVYAEDAKRWPDIPNTSANNLHQIVDFWCRRAAMLDKNIEAL